MIKGLRQKGATLIEILLYFAIIGVVLLAAMSFSLQVIDLTKRSDSFHEIQSNINLISERIVSTIQQADSVDDAGSIFDNDAGTLSLNVTPSGKSPTRFYIAEDTVYMKEGSTAEVKLSSDLVTCNQLRFRKISYPKAPDLIVIDAEFEYLQQTLSFHTSASLRKL